MAREIIVRIPDLNVEARANLLIDKAPRTCDAIWNQLARPLEMLGTHAMWTGPEISMQVAEEDAVSDLLEIPDENQTIFPPAGSIAWAYMPPHAFGGRPGHLYDIGIFYGPSGRVFLPVGWIPVNHFGQLKGDWTEFQQACRTILTKGQRVLRFERA